MRNVLLIIMVIFLFSCSLALAQTPTTMPVSQSATPSATFPPPTETLSPTATPQPTVTVTVPIPSKTATPKPVFQLCSPLAEQTIQEIPEIVSDPYNPPRPGEEFRHHGVDLGYFRRKDRTSILGEVVQAILAGRVVAWINDKLPYGNMLIVETPRSALPPEITAQFEIDEGQSLYILYAHFQYPPIVVLGDQVACGQALGQVGTSGYNIVNPHVHIETRVGPAGHTFDDGMAYYYTRTTEAERANYELWRTSGMFRHFDPMTLIDTYITNWAGK